ncbi:hypothetical protein ACQJBY_030544 [Aegilops geniculata]
MELGLLGLSLMASARRRPRGLFTKQRGRSISATCSMISSMNFGEMLDNLVEKGRHAEVYNGQLANGQFVAVKRMLRGRLRRAGAAGGGTSCWSRRSSPSSAGAALATPTPGPSTSGKEAIIHPVSETINTHTLCFTRTTHYVNRKL